MRQRLTISTCISTLVVALVFGSAVLTFSNSIEAAGPPGQELIQLPLRWCALRGSDGAMNPGSVGEPTTNDYLWRRHERASDRVLIPGAGITFRSAFTAGMGANASFPVINDPRPPGIGPGAEGDILDPIVDPAELNEAWAACDQAWDALVKPGVPLVGFPAVNIHRFVKADGSPASATGRGAFSFTDSTQAGLCANPPSISGVAFRWSARIAVSDYSLIRGYDPDDLVVAHELGHALSLDHGNGLDDDNDSLYDLWCDPTENVNATPRSIMTAGNETRAVTALQRGTTRTIARKITGAQIDPPAALVNADTLSDQRTDPVRDVLEPGIDLASVAFASVPSNGAVIISHLLFGLIDREQIENQYLFFADIDNDITTGGAPAELGFTTAFTGAELVTRVVIGPGHSATPSLWLYRNGAFEEIETELAAEVSTQFEGETRQPISDLVTIVLPPGLVNSLPPEIRIQAIAEALSGNHELDVLPNGSMAGFRPLYLVPPEFPVCAVDPLVADPGETVIIEVYGLLPSKSAHVVLGDTLVATDTLGVNGDALIELVLPGDTLPGPRLVTVGVDGTALTADCLLTVRGQDKEG